MKLKNPWPKYYKKDVVTHYCPGCGHGIVHRIVAERPDAADEPEAFCQRLAQVIAHELGELSAMKPASRLAARHSRYRNLGLG